MMLAVRECRALGHWRTLSEIGKEGGEEVEAKRSDDEDRCEDGAYVALC
jgi:hypothetical protein